MNYVVRSGVRLFTKFPGRSIMFLCILSMFFLCIHALFFVYDVLLQTEDVLNDKMSISLYVQDEYTYESQQMQSFLADIQTSSPPFRFEYISKDVALDRELQRNSELLDILGDENPLPDSIVLQVTPGHTEEILDLISRYSYLFLVHDIDENQKYEAQLEVIHDFQKNFFIIQMLIYVLLFLFLASVSFFTFLFVQNHAFLFLQEIRIAVRVGASFLRVALPYVILVFLLLLAAFLLALACTYSARAVWPFDTFGIPLLTGDVYTYDSFLIHSAWFFFYELVCVSIIGLLSVLFSLSRMFISKIR